MAKVENGVSQPGVEEKTSEEKRKDRHAFAQAEFIEDMAEYMKRPGNDSVETVLRRLEQLHQRYKRIEASISDRRARMQFKLPDLKNSLLMAQVLAKKKETNESTETQFIISDQCYAKATIPPSDKVCLWLGANVMLEYDVAEAIKLLTTNMEGAEKGVSELADDLDFVKDQLTTTEVNIARVYNYGVQQRKAQSTSAKPPPTYSI